MMQGFVSLCEPSLTVQVYIHVLVHVHVHTSAHIYTTGLNIIRIIIMCIYIGIVQIRVIYM